MTAKHPDATREAVIAAYIDGERVADIAGQHGIATETVRVWARKAGVARDRSMYAAPPYEPTALTGGRWVPVGGIMRWQPEMDEAS